MIAVENITYKHKDFAILKNINFKAESGKLIAIVGPNGAGKTSLMNYLANELDCKKKQNRIQI